MQRPGNTPHPSAHCVASAQSRAHPAAARGWQNTAMLPHVTGLADPACESVDACRVAWTTTKSMPMRWPAGAWLCCSTTSRAGPGSLPQACHARSWSHCHKRCGPAGASCQHSVHRAVLGRAASSQIQRHGTMHVPCHSASSAEVPTRPALLLAGIMAVRAAHLQTSKVSCKGAMTQRQFPAGGGAA